MGIKKRISCLLCFFLGVTVHTVTLAEHGIFLNNDVAVYGRVSVQTCYHFPTKPTVCKTVVVPASQRQYYPVDALAEVPKNVVVNVTSLKDGTTCSFSAQNENSTFSEVYTRIGTTRFCEKTEIRFV